MYLNFYNYLIIELPSTIDISYFNEFKQEEINKDVKVNLKLSFTKKINNANHILVSNYMSYDPIEKSIFLIDKNGKYCQSVFGHLNEESLSLVCEEGFNSGDIVAYIIKPLLRKALIKNNHAFIHASSFAYNNKATLIAAWAHTGKTNTLLSNIMNGAEYLGDDLSIICSDGTIRPFPSPINLFYYNLRDIPEIRNKIKKKFKLKFYITSKVSMLFNLFNKLANNPNMKYLFYAGKTFFDSASHVPYKTHISYKINDDNLKFKVLRNILLERSNKITESYETKEIEPEEFALRMQECINYEFQRFNELSTSAKWIPFYNGDDLFNNEELKIYQDFANQVNPVNILIPKKMNFKKVDFLNKVNNK